MRIKAALLASVALAIAAAQSNAPDLRGWSTSTWGMTAAEVRAAFPAAAGVSPADRDFGNLGTLQLRDIEIGPVRGSATFYFPPDTDRLVAVRLRPDPSLPCASAFAQLQEALVEKYGRPTSAEKVTDRITTHTVQWNLRSTVIRLAWFDGGRDLGSVSIRYTERKPADSL